ncbi:MAG: ParB/RepB/Spo0J family partition protein [Nitrospiraceae bacterium]
MEKRALGKGLDALLPASVANQGSEGLDSHELSIASIVPNRFQPRQEFSEPELNELAHSIKQNGLLQPVLVRRKGDGFFELISGERRLRAAKLVGMEKISAVIRNCNDQEAMILALIENIQRNDLNPMETARAYHRMLNEFGLTQDIIAQRVGRDRSSIANTVRLINLPGDVQHLVEIGQLTAGHAKVILGLDNQEAQLKLARRIVDQELSVRETEKLVESQSVERRSARRLVRQSQSSDVEERLRKRLGTRVTMMKSRRGGKIVIHYFSPAELEGLLEILLH